MDELHDKLRQGLINLRDMARSGLKPDVMGYTEEQWLNHKLDYCAGLASHMIALIDLDTQDRADCQSSLNTLADVLLSMAHADGCWCEASFAMPGTTVGHTQECEAAKAILNKLNKDRP